MEAHLRFLVAFTCLTLFFSLDSTLFAQGYFVGRGWTKTATDGGGLERGDAATLTWGILANGTPITGVYEGESDDPSNLIGFLDDNIGAGPGGDDLTQRPWFTLFEKSYKRWDEVSGLRFVYEPNDNGDDLQDFPEGLLGSVADMRVGGHSIDGQDGSNILAYNYFPNRGDMVIDTDNIDFYTNASGNYRRLRNVLMHEVGHGIGISHLESNDASFLMEPFASAAFDGPQFADILAAQRLYGDNYEEDGGNDVVANASALELDEGIALIGEHADSTRVEATENDFVSIDGDDDTDFYSFELTQRIEVNIVLTPMGPVYNSRRQGAQRYNVFDASVQNDLRLTLFDSDGSTVLETANWGGYGEEERISRMLSAGTYFIRVDAPLDSAQMYSLYVSAVPEPEMILVLALGCIGAYVVVRRQKKLASNEVN